MKISKNETAPRFLIVGIFAVIFVFGLFGSQRAGTSWDEANDRRTGIINLREYANFLAPHLPSRVKQSLPQSPRIYEYEWRYNGPVLQYPMILAERLLKINRSARLWQVRHAIQFIYFFLGLIALYHICRKLDLSALASMAAVFMVLLFPRFLAEGAYNTKDLGLFSMILVLMLIGLRFAKTGGIQSALLFAITTGLACGVRISAGFAAALFVILRLVAAVKERRSLAKIIVELAVYAGAAVLALYFVYPGSWFDPVLFFPKLLRTMSHFPWNNPVLFLGQSHMAADLPRYYLPAWMAVTVPLFILGLWLIGNIFIFKTRSSDLNTWALRGFGASVFLIVSIVVCTKPVMYDGWRHFYFLFAFMAPVAAYGFEALILSFKAAKHRPLIIGLAALLFLDGTFTAIKSFKLAPYQNVYFNALAGKTPGKFFETDYWGLSFREGAEWIARDRGAIPTVIAVSGPAHLLLDFLPQKHREVYQIRRNENPLDNADYYVFQHRGGSLPPDLKPAFKIERLGIPLIWIYRIDRAERSGG